MKWTITYATNFVRIFRLPNKFPSDYCFSGGHPTMFVLVDWFNPFGQEDFWEDKTKEFDGNDIEYLKHIEEFKDFIKAKKYFNSNFTFMALTDYGDAFVINPEKRAHELQEQYENVRNNAVENMESTDAEEA